MLGHKKGGPCTHSGPCCGAGKRRGPAPDIPAWPSGCVPLRKGPTTGPCGSRRTGGSPRETARITSTSPFASTAHLAPGPHDGSAAGPAVRGLHSSFIHRIAGANLEGAGRAGSAWMPAKRPGYLVASMSRSGGTHRTANPVLTEENNARTGSLR